MTNINNPANNEKFEQRVGETNLVSVFHTAKQLLMLEDDSDRTWHLVNHEGILRRAAATSEDAFKPGVLFVEYANNQGEPEWRVYFEPYDDEFAESAATVVNLRTEEYTTFTIYDGRLIMKVEPDNNTWFVDNMSNIADVLSDANILGTRNQ